MKKIVLFASGSGTNAENIVLHFNKTNRGTVAAIFSNNPNAKVLERAQKLNVPAVVFSKEEFIDGTIVQKLRDLQPDLIVLAGFLLKLPPAFVEAFPDRIINIHPALLPKYGGKGMYGMHVHRAIIENKEVETGISIHFVNEHYDEGNMIFQKTVSLDGTETPEEVAEKVHQLEQLHFPEIISELLNG